nr:FLYWCH-type zinc finger-containing protein 1-like [Aedes albopictus]
MDDLVKIYSPKPALYPSKTLLGYTARLLDIIFGREILVGACIERLVDDDDLEQLDSHKLRSVIGSPKLRAAKFGYTQKGRAMLLYNGYAYIKDRQAQKSCNWKCSLFGKLKCRARAVTKEVNGRQMMKITKPLHNHTRNVIYVLSKRGTKHLFHDGNTYTPNERPYPGQRSRTWKCSLYYRLKCRARIVTSEAGGLPKLRVVVAEHTHSKVFPNLTHKFRIKRRHSGAQIEYRGRDVTFSPSCRGMPKMMLEGYVYIRNAGNATKTYWLCERGKRFKCRARAITYRGTGLKRRYVGAQIEYRGRGVTFSIRRGHRCMPKMTLEGYVYRRNAGNAIKTYWRCEREKRFKCCARAITYRDTSNPTLNRLLFIKGQRGPKLIFDGYSFNRNKGHGQATYWRCTKHQSLGCKAKLVTTNLGKKISIGTPVHCHKADYDFEQYFSELEPVATKKTTTISLDNQELDFVPGKRGTSLLRINNYCYARNNKSQNSSYWVCRTRAQHRPCNSRVVTTLKNNGLYRVVITNPVHLHEPNKSGANRSIGQARRMPKLVAPKPVLEEIFTFTFDSD